MAVVQKQACLFMIMELHSAPQVQSGQRHHLAKTTDFFRTLVRICVNHRHHFTYTLSITSWSKLYHVLDSSFYGSGLTSGYIPLLNICCRGQSVCLISRLLGIGGLALSWLWSLPEGCVQKVQLREGLKALWVLNCGMSQGWSGNMMCSSTSTVYKAVGDMKCIAISLLMTRNSLSPLHPVQWMLPGCLNAVWPPFWNGPGLRGWS